jgi:hypothetical protein
MAEKPENVMRKRLVSAPVSNSGAARSSRTSRSKKSLRASGVG